MTFQLAGDSPDIYEKVMVPLWFERRADALIDVLALRPGGNVLDAACGMGVETGSRQDALNIEGRLGPEAVANSRAVCRPSLLSPTNSC